MERSNVGFCRKVDDPVTSLHGIMDCLSVADITLNEPEAMVSAHWIEIVRIPGVCQFVHHHDMVIGTG